MRVLCPSCQQLVTVPDTAAGQMTACPQCGKSFAPPALTGAALDAAPPPVAPPAPVAPPIATIRPSETARLPETPAPVRTASEPSCRCTLRKDVVRWVAPVALFLAFILSFFTWLAVAPNGTVVYAQNGWKAAAGSLTTADMVGDEVLAQENALKSNSGVNLWLVFFLIFLILTAALAIGDLVVTTMTLTVPDIFRTIWPHRNVLILGLTVLLVVLLVTPMIKGFGLEESAVMAAEKAVPAPTAEGAAPTTRQIQQRDLRRDLEVAKFAVHRRAWFCLAFFAILTAMVGAGMSVWLERRGTQPEPRLEFYC